ncbi:MAG TPA: hypothetical protein VFQ38_20900 [Longimicrobiales bacterium]|nr:hypothetical protein [Longimicrobiales bacterium]
MALAALLAACSRSAAPQRACTLIGCESGLAVRLDAPPAGAYRVEATGPGAPSPRVQECDAATRCGGHIYFRDFTPDVATIRIVAGADTVTRTVRPSYKTLQPNGPDCPPTCRRAEVRIGGG